MSETSHTDMAGASRERWLKMLFPAVILALLVVLFQFQGNSTEVGEYGRSLARWLMYAWSLQGGAMSHGCLIPFVSAYFLWTSRKELASASKRVSMTGLVLVILSLVLHWIGLRAQQPRLSLLALIGLSWSIPLYIYGWRVAGIILFPCAYLLFTVPTAFLDSLTFPLRVFGTTLSAGILNGFGVAVVRVGTAIHSVSGGFSLGVDDPCSGIKSLLALMAVTAAYAQVSQRTLVRKWVLFLLAVPLALAGNVCRIVTIGLVGSIWNSEQAMRIYHDYSTYLVFFFAVVLMIGVGTGINRIGLRREKKCSPESTGQN